MGQIQEVNNGERSSLLGRVVGLMVAQYYAKYETELEFF